MDNQLLIELAHLVMRQTYLLVAMCGFMVVGLVVLALQLRATSADLKAIAAMTAAVLRNR